MVKHAVHHNPDAAFVAEGDEMAKILVGSQAAVDLKEIPGIIAMRIGFKHRREIHRANPQLLQMGNPFFHFGDTVGGNAVVLKRRAAEPHGINLIEHRAFRPVFLGLTL